MSKPRIEYSGQRNKFSWEEIEAEVRKSKAHQATPEGKAETRQMEIRAEKARGLGVKFPELGNRGTNPAVASRAYWQRRLVLLEKSAPKI